MDRLVEGIDWQMVSFVAMTLLKDYVTVHLPQVYYWNSEKERLLKQYNQHRK